jgi:hypothetical protein
MHDCCSIRQQNRPHILTISCCDNSHLTAALLRPESSPSSAHRLGTWTTKQHQQQQPHFDASDASASHIGVS